MSDGDLGSDDLGGINVGLGDTLAQAGHLANFLEIDDLARLVPIDTKTSRIVTTIFLTSKSVAKDLEEFLAVLEMIQSDIEARS